MRDVVEEERLCRCGAVPFEGGERAVPLADLVHSPELSPEEPRHEDAVEAPVGDDQRGARARGLQPREKAFGPNGGGRPRLPPRRGQGPLAPPPPRALTPEPSLSISPVNGRPDQTPQSNSTRSASSETPRPSGAATMAAVSRARISGLAHTSSIASPARRIARYSAWRLPRAERGVSKREPCNEPAKLK